MESMSEIRVRFAPSPTGPLHIGGVRTALYNYLFARKNNGKLILRIEDTDQTRFVPGAESYIIESLKWCGIQFDEGISGTGPYAPYRQSERKNIYIQFADQLIASQNAYYAFDTPEELNLVREKFDKEGKTFAYDIKTRILLKNSLTLPENETQRLLADGHPYTIRFKIPENMELEMTDLVRGNIQVNTSTLDDKVIFKSDGLPTYHLANVVDDHIMQISHVIRGEEWLPSLPLHYLLYKALGWEKEMPLFAHLPLILKPSGKGKLSKRDGDKEGFPVFPLQWTDEKGEVSTGYKESGYFAEAFINFLAMLGWNPGTEQEIFSLDELVAAFSIERVQKGGARFDIEKAKWFNQHYLKNMKGDQLASLFMPILELKGIKSDPGYVAKVCELVKERAVFIEDIWEQGSFFFEQPEAYDEKTVKKFWKEDTSQILTDIQGILRDDDGKNPEKLECAVKNYIETKELGFGKVMNPLRICLVGTNKGPHLFDIIAMIGIEESIKRIGNAIRKLG
jgi:glutamyl-tRNA synthetase